MKYKLINPIKENYSVLQQILFNRNIKEKDMWHYLNTTDEDINDFRLLGEDKLKEAAIVLVSAIQNNQEAIIIVDSDCDGYTSSALLINFLHKYFSTWVETNLTWFIHDGKQHGLNDCIDYILNNNFKLVLLPDAGSNDYEEHARLKKAGIKTIVLDHHEAPKVSEDAIVINNQLSDYPNKALSGVGVTWQFCRYLDSLLKSNYADNFLDLVALGLVADMMSLSVLETRHLISKGFKVENVCNPFIYYMWQKNKFKLGEEITAWGSAFYIAPFVNAMNRSGTLEEKKLLFESMLDFKAFEKLSSTKRGHLLGEMEPLYEQAIRVCSNVKRRQTKEQDASVEYLTKIMEDKRLLDHKVLLFLLKPGEVNPKIAGLIANKFMAKYQRPTAILIEGKNDKGQLVYQGSARGYEASGISNFKSICEKAPSCIFSAGHADAFGLGLENKKDLLNDFIKFMDDYFKNVNSEPLYRVDYIFQSNHFDKNSILAIAELNGMWGKDFEESHIAIEDLTVTSDMLVLMSPDKNPTLKISLSNGVEIIKFNSSEEEYTKLNKPMGFIKLNLIGTCDKNEWNGNVKPQVLVTDYEIIDSLNYYF